MVSAEQEALIYRLDGEGLPPMQIAMVVSLSSSVVIGVLRGHVPKEACRSADYIPTKAEIKAAAKECRKQRRMRLYRQKNTEQRRIETQKKLLEDCFTDYPE